MADGAVIGNLTIPVIKGDKGDKGNTGEIISISLVLLSPSSTAYAVNNGSTTQAQIELGIPKGLSVSTTNINASGELVFTFNDNSTVNVGQVVGKGISEVTVTDDFDFVVTYTDGTSVTACNLEEEILGAINDILESYYTKTEIDEMGFITKEVNNLTNYTLKTNTGSSIELSINSSTYVMTLNLKNSAGTTISTGTIDLPLETMVVGATYDNTNKKIVLTLKNGSTIDVPVADLVSGLQAEITNANKLSADLVDDTSTTHKFTSTSEKNSWNAKYDKPSGGIPSTDMSSSVQTSLEKAETAIQDVSGKEDKSNKTGILDENSTDTQYPHAKAVYDFTNNNYIQWKPYKNIFNKDSTDNVNGFYINQANGYKNVNTNFSAYILKIEGGKTISVSGGGGVQIGFATEYTNLSTLNTNTQVNGWISGGFSGNNISVPLNAKYLFVSSVTNSFGDLQVEYNKYSTEYTPYKLVVPNTRELQEQIDVLDLSLENKIDYVKSKNIFNKNSTDKADGFWINNTNGHAYKNTNSALSIVMLPIIGGKTISIKGCSNVSQYAFCSEYTDIVSLSTNYTLKGYISGSNFNATKLEGLVVPDNAKYMAISTTTSFMNNVQIEYNERCTSFEPYGNSIPTNEHIVKVGIGEDYQTLKEGIEYATQFQNSIVKVKKGTYDLVEEFEDELETSVGLILKNNVHIIFEVGTKVKFNYNGNSEHVHTSFSPFNSGVNGFVIENLDLEASNCKYCIHDERGNSTDFYHNVYKNCRMKLDNSQNPDWVNPQNIGAGLANGVIEIENCRFNNWISFHNNNGTQTNSKSNVYIKDSYFESGSVILGSYGNTTEISNFYISGNFMNSNIINQDTSSTPLINVELHAWNNVIAGKNIISTITLTQAEYDALTSYDDNTNYQIIEN